jgi:phenylacetate-CoA ligase
MVMEITHHPLPQSFESVNVWYHILCNLRTLRKNTWLSSSELEKMQMKRLRAILEHAYESVPFHHRRFDMAKVKPRDIKSIQDLHKIPILTKSEVRSNFNSLISKRTNLRLCVKEETSGSTGIPLTIIANKQLSYLIGANRLRHYVENGGKLFRDKYAFLTSRKLSDGRSILGSFLKHLGIFRRVRMCTQDQMETIFGSLVDFEPDVIECYPSFLLLLAREIEKEGKLICPRLIFGGGELLDCGSRRMINSTFENEMLDIYGCTEGGDIAWECSEHAGYHTNVDLIVTEFIKDGEHVTAGESGEIILTPLFNYAMPLIRYRIGDIGTPSNEYCPCGRRLPLMKVIEGRHEDFIVLPSGRIITPSVTSRYFENIEGIAEYKIIQKKRDEFIIQIVLEERHNDYLLTQLSDRFKKGFREDVTINIEVLDVIPRKGKLRRVVSKLNHEQFLSF